jgi:hypothetical protein
MAECVKITYDRYTQELVFEKVQGPDPGAQFSKTMTVTSGPWEGQEPGYSFNYSWQTSEGQLGAPVLSFALPHPFLESGVDSTSSTLDVGVACHLPGPDPDEQFEFSRWVGWVTAHVQSPFDIGEVLQDMRDDRDTEGVVGRRIGIPYSDGSGGVVGPQNTTIVLGLYEKWPGPPSRENFWTDLQGSREFVD